MTANHRPLEEGDIELIDRIRATPSLYDTRDPDFRLVGKKDQDWQTIADGITMTHWEARKRWTVLRDRYARELKQLLLHPDSMEYGKNEFFHRMDFLRNFVKKRRVKKKSYNLQGEEIEEKKYKRPRPLKISKVDSNIEHFEIYEQVADDQKTYIIDDSQESSSTMGKFSYVEQSSQDHHHQQQHQQQLQHENHLVEHDVEQDYQEYVEDASESYEAVVMDPEIHHHDISNHSSVVDTTNNSLGSHMKPELATQTTITENYSITTINEPKAAPCLPQLQHKPLIQTTYTNSPSSSATSEQNDSEEYFSKTIASYLKQLCRRNKIKAKVEMMQILEKYIEIEENDKKS